MILPHVNLSETGKNTKKNVITKIGLVSLFNGISTFAGYLMTKPFSSKNIRGTI